MDLRDGRDRTAPQPLEEPGVPTGLVHPFHGRRRQVFLRRSRHIVAGAEAPASSAKDHHLRVSALLDGFTDYIFMTVDMADPTKPKEAGRYWLPGMNKAAGETPSWPANKRYGLHHAIVNGDTAYGRWRAGGPRAGPPRTAHAPRSTSAAPDPSTKHSPSWATRARAPAALTRVVTDGPIAIGYLTIIER